ncbi:hypothetical protein BHM03_00058450 [Ensete ventricosum]|nr:hypothetical protein BHM03_00058450 [Ensete ventricosum]
MSWSYVGHVVAIVPDKSPTACHRGRCTLVGRCACPDTPSVASCQKSGVLFASRPLRLPWHVACCQLPGDIVRWSAVTPTLTRRLSPVVGGQGGGWSGTSALLRRSLTGGQLVGHRAVRGYPELMVTEGCVSFSTESTMAEGRALGTTDLKTAEKRVSGVIELKMVERHVSGTTRLMLA